MLCSKFKAAQECPVDSLILNSRLEPYDSRRLSLRMHIWVIMYMCPLSEILQYTSLVFWTGRTESRCVDPPCGPVRRVSSDVGGSGPWGWRSSREGTLCRAVLYGQNTRNWEGLVAACCCGSLVFSWQSALLIRTRYIGNPRSTSPPENSYARNEGSRFSTAYFGSVVYQYRR